MEARMLIATQTPDSIQTYSRPMLALFQDMQTQHLLAAPMEQLGEVAWEVPRRMEQAVPIVIPLFYHLENLVRIQPHLANLTELRGKNKK